MGRLPPTFHEKETSSLSACGVTVNGRPEGHETCFERVAMLKNISYVVRYLNGRKTNGGAQTERSGWLDPAAADGRGTWEKLGSPQPS